MLSDHLPGRLGAGESRPGNRQPAGRRVIPTSWPSLTEGAHPQRLVDPRAAGTTRRHPLTELACLRELPKEDRAAATAVARRLLAGHLPVVFGVRTHDAMFPSLACTEPDSIRC